MCRLKRTIIGQIRHGTDLFEELTSIAEREGIRLGRISGIGATIDAKIAYYDQTKKNYISMELGGGMEILNIQGNVTMRDAKPFVHAHILLGDREGKVFGGHLLKGTKVWACEIIIDEYEGDDLERGQDDITGLFLWKTGFLS